MIQVTANETNDFHDKGEVVTKLNRRGRNRLNETILHSLHHLKYGKDELTMIGYEDNPTYQETVDLYVSLFGRRPSGH